MTQKRFALMFVLLVFLGGLLAACQDDEAAEMAQAKTYAAQTLTAIPTETPLPTMTATPTPVPATPTATPTLTPTQAPVGPDNFPDDVNPLTGLMVADPALLARRPVLVKVANYPASGRPHAGLSFADLVFEYYIGYGSNRFMAVYYGKNTDKIGPVRSGRLVDPKIVSMYQGILGFQGAYETIYSDIVAKLGDRAISGTGNVCPAICDDGRGIVTSVFANSAELTQLYVNRGGDQQQFALPGMRFDPVAPDGGLPGEQVNILFSNLNRGEWRFDDETGLYLRWIEEIGEGEELTMIPLVDSQTDAQLAFANVIVMFGYYTEYAPAMHDVDIWGNTTGRRAVVFRDGQAYDVFWKTTARDQPISFYDSNGDIFPLKPGNSWMVIMGVNSGAVQLDAEWTFNFYLP